MMPGSTELMIILGVTLIIFGPTKLPLLGKAIGESIKNFKKGVSENEKDI
jgi:sec-independent protein translocase protein TatA